MEFTKDELDDLCSALCTEQTKWVMRAYGEGYESESCLRIARRANALYKKVNAEREAMEVSQAWPA